MNDLIPGQLLQADDTNTRLLYLIALHLDAMARHAGTKDAPRLPLGFYPTPEEINGLAASIRQSLLEPPASETVPAKGLRMVGSFGPELDKTMEITTKELKAHLEKVVANQQVQTQALQACQKQLSCCVEALSKLLSHQQRSVALTQPVLG